MKVFSVILLALGLIAVASAAPSPQSVVEEIKATLNDFVDLVKATGGDTLEKAKEFAGSANGKYQDVANKAIDAAKELIVSAKEKYGAVAAEALTKAKEFVDDARSKATVYANSVVKDFAKEMIMRQLGLVITQKIFSFIFSN